MNLSPRRHEEPEINLTPLIDVVFLLLIFFMVSTTFVRSADLQVSLPEAALEPTRAAEQPLELTITRQGSFALDGESLVNAQMDTVRLALEQARAVREDISLVIRADAQTPHQAVVTALEAAGKAGISQVGIATTAETDE